MISYSGCLCVCVCVIILHYSTSHYFSLQYLSLLLVTSHSAHSLPLVSLCLPRTWPLSAHSFKPLLSSPRRRQVLGWRNLKLASCSSFQPLHLHSISRLGIQPKIWYELTLIFKVCRLKPGDHKRTKTIRRRYEAAELIMHFHELLLGWIWNTSKWVKRALASKNDSNSQSCHHKRASVVHVYGPPWACSCSECCKGPSGCTTEQASRH